MMKEMLPMGAVGLGIFLLVLSAVWGFLFPASNSWTHEKAKRMSEVQDQVHILLYQAVAAKQRPNLKSGKNPAEVQVQYQEAQEELKSLRTEFETLRDRPEAAAKGIRWAGIALVLIASGATLLMRSA